MTTFTRRAAPRPGPGRSGALAGVLLLAGLALVSGMLPLAIGGSGRPGEDGSIRRAGALPGGETPVEHEPPAAATRRPAGTAAAAGRHPAPIDPVIVEPLDASRAPAVPPASAAIARALDRLRSEPAPPNEVFAMLTLTDRSTGERRAFTRGELDLEAALAVAYPDPDSEGISYEEGEKGFTEGDVEIVTRWIVAHPSARRPGAMTREEEEELALFERNRDGGLSHRIDGGLRRRILDGEIDLSGALMVPVVIDLKGIPPLRIPRLHDDAPAGLLFVALDAQAARERAIIERKKEMPARQAGVTQAILAGGGKIRFASWMSGAVTAVLPARAIPLIASRADVFRIEYDEPLVTHNHAFMGNDYYVAMDAGDYDNYHAGAYGPIGKHVYSGRVVMGLSEECLDVYNPAFRDDAGTLKRFWPHDCDDTTFCVQAGVEDCSGPGSFASHGTKVAQLMAGDFMDGQDPAIVLQSTRRIITGVCEECAFHFIQDQFLDQRSKAHAYACEQGMDIFESSVGTTAISCDGSGPFDSDIQAMVNCGIHYVQSAGNEGSGGGCTTTHPADDPWTLTVGGMRTDGLCISPGAYYTPSCVYDPDASKGGGTYNNFYTTSIIDLTAPYRMGNLLVPKTANPVTWTHGNGTSFGTPIVAGLMARFMDMYLAHYSSSIFYANRGRVMMLLWGDRSDQPAGTSLLVNDFSDWWGAGRVGLVDFDFNYDVGLYRASKVLQYGESWSFTDTTIKPSATFYKGVVWHDGLDYDTEPRIRLTLAPANCASSFAPKQVERSDSKVMLVYSGHAGSLNQCNDVNVTITNLGNKWSGSRTFHYAAYFDIQAERVY